MFIYIQYMVEKWYSIFFFMFRNNHIVAEIQNETSTKMYTSQWGNNYLNNFFLFIINYAEKEDFIPIFDQSSHQQK